jgi:hypothetical protein
MFLFCDIDGVLIPFPGADGSAPGTHQITQVTPAGYEQPVPIWLNPEHGPLLAGLIAATGLRPIWCTSWRQDAARLIGPRLQERAPGRGRHCGHLSSCPQASVRS